ncbi:MAG: ArnT family glycosyltransferase [Myxococcota bacterium]
MALFVLDFHLDTRERDVFSWMDPYQYYEFASGFLEGRERFDSFEIPSIFPFFTLPALALDASVAGSLWVNIAALLLLLAGIHALCRELAVRTPSPLVALLILSSPMLLGLSRTLYVEFTLTAIATVAFVTLLRFLREPQWRSGLAFAAFYVLGFMTKTTFPLFVVPPLAGAALGRLAARRRSEAAWLLAAAVVPPAFAMAIHASVFSPSLGYYWNLVSTALPFMFLMGPPEPWSWESATYYFGEIGRSILWLLTPLLIFPIAASARRWRAIGLRDLATPRATLWLWFIGPMLLLIAHPLKEPRHVATCVVPGVLLLVLGIEGLPRRALRAAGTVAALALAAVQYAAVTSGIVPSLYFMDRSIHYEQIRDRMLLAGGPGSHDRTPDDLRQLHWNYDHNVAVAGFPPNEALALTWQGFPGVTFDLGSFHDPSRFSDRIPFAQFEDLFFLAAINTYNRRCGWHGYYGSLSREAVVENADFLIVNGDAAYREFAELASHELVATIEPSGDVIRILRSRRPTIPYRTLYAREFLARNPDLPAEEIRVVAQEMVMAAVLSGDEEDVRSLAGEFPQLRDRGIAPRNIHWIAGYPALIRLAQQRVEAIVLPSGHPKRAD